MNDEIQMTNDESNPNVQMTNDQNRPPCKAGDGIAGPPGFRHSSFHHSVIDSSFVIRHSNFRGAFTLVEVLVSLSILAVLLPAIMYGLSLESRMAAAARNRTQAASLGSQKLNDILANFPTDGLAQTAGDFADQGPQFSRFKWSAALNDFQSDTADGVTATLQEIDLTVTWQESGQDRSLLLSSLVYQKTSTTGGL